MMIYVFHGFGSFIFSSEARMVLNQHIHQRLERLCTLRISDRSACPLLQIVAARYADTWRSLIDRFRISSATTFRPESMFFSDQMNFTKDVSLGTHSYWLQHVIARTCPYHPQIYISLEEHHVALSENRYPQSIHWLIIIWGVSSMFTPEYHNRR